MSITVLKFSGEMQTSKRTVIPCSIACESFRFKNARNGSVPAVFQNAKNARKKTGNLFLISCLGVPFYVAAVIQLFAGYNSTN